MNSLSKPADNQPRHSLPSGEILLCTDCCCECPPGLNLTFWDSPFPDRFPRATAVTAQNAAVSRELTLARCCSPTELQGGSGGHQPSPLCWESAQPLAGSEKGNSVGAAPQNCPSYSQGLSITAASRTLFSPQFLLLSLATMSDH